MTNTVAHTAPKRGTSARLGLRLPKPRARILATDLIMASSAVWSRPHQDVTDTSRMPVAEGLSLMTGEAWYRPVPIKVTNVTASRHGEPVPMSEVVAELMKGLKPDRGADAAADVMLNPVLARAFGVPVPKLRPMSRIGMPFDHTTECCGITHTFDAGVSSWLPGCAHLGSV